MVNPNKILGENSVLVDYRREYALIANENVLNSGRRFFDCRNQSIQNRLRTVVATHRVDG